MKIVNGNEPHYYSDRLKLKLNKLCSTPAAIIEAPSGYGKTTAVRDFLESALPQGTPVYWFTGNDEAPAAGFRSLCREIEKIDGRAGRRLLKIELPNAATVGEACDALRSMDCRYEAYLVLDNFQFLQAALPQAFLTALMEHGGKSLHIILVTQMLKREMLAVIACHGVLHITAADLRLDAEDIRRYFALAGADIAPRDANMIERRTEGWVIAVYLQLCAFREKGSLSDISGILTLMEHLVWNPLTEPKQTFLLCLSPFETVTVRQACVLTGYDALPKYAREALASPFIHYEPAERRYELHSILTELLIRKRGERGAAFERGCLLRAGDFCRDDGKTDKALGFYAQIRDYERMLSLDLSQLALEDIGTVPFSTLALDIAKHCPAQIKGHHILSMLQVAWALLLAGMNAQFSTLMEELHVLVEPDSQENNSILLGEWILLSSFEAFPRLDEMTAILRQAAELFKGKCSQVILPTAPWCFGNYSSLAAFHAVPGEADREADALEEYVSLYSRLTNGGGSGADVMFRTELAYHRGNLSDAEIFAYKAVFLAESRQQSIVQLGATLQLAEIALHKADEEGWHHAIDSMERAASYASQNTYIVRSVLDTVRGVLLTELKDQSGIADWLQTGQFTDRLHLTPMVNNALFVYMMYLMHQGEFAHLVGTTEAMPPEIREQNPFADLLISILMAVGHMQLGRRDRAAALVEHAAERALPDGLVFPFAAYSWMLQGLSDELIANKYPLHLKRYNDIKERFAAGWDTLHSAMFADELPADLTAREYEIATLAAGGLHNSEIASELMVTESTVRSHLRAIFQKLDIDRRAKLAERLK